MACRLEDSAYTLSAPMQEGLAVHLEETSRIIIMPTVFTHLRGDDLTKKGQLYRPKRIFNTYDFLTPDNPYHYFFKCLNG
jgi:hypothetical protein